LGSAKRRDAPKRRHTALDRRDGSGAYPPGWAVDALGGGRGQIVGNTGVAMRLEPGD
jgi:hypothetical protein